MSNQLIPSRARWRWKLAVLPVVVVLLAAGAYVALRRPAAEHPGTVLVRADRAVAARTGPVVVKDGYVQLDKTLLSVYRSQTPSDPKGWRDKLAAYEQWLGGRRLDLAYATGHDECQSPDVSYCWQQVLGGTGSTDHDGDLLGPWEGHKPLMMTFSVLPSREQGRRDGIGEGPTSLAACGAGVYDARWSDFARRLVERDQAWAILRPLREFNGNWYAWGFQPNGPSDKGRPGYGDRPAAYAQDFKACFHRLVTTMRSVPGQHFKFMWNPIVGTDGGAFDPRSAFPYAHPEDVDLVGIDVYDENHPAGSPNYCPTPSDYRDDIEKCRREVWRQKLNGPLGIEAYRKFAQQVKKPLAMPEWGLVLWQGAGRHGGGDNDYFIRRMYADVLTNPRYHLKLQSYWDADPVGLFERDVRKGDGQCDGATSSGGGGNPRCKAFTQAVPRARAAFLELFKVRPQKGCAGPAPDPSVYGRVELNVDVPSSGDYRAWGRLRSPNAGVDSFWLQVDDGCPMAIGDKPGQGAAPGTWTWAAGAEQHLKAGRHTIRLTGREVGGPEHLTDPGVQVDRVLLTGDHGCTPTGTDGGACAGAAQQ